MCQYVVHCYAPHEGCSDFATEVYDTETGDIPPEDWTELGFRGEAWPTCTESLWMVPPAIGECDA
jgi:hypothetical protein